MSYRTILTHIDLSAEADARLRLAVHVARFFDAALIGLSARAFDVLPDPTGASVRALKNEIEANFRNSEKLFHEKVGLLAHGSIWRSAMNFPAKALVQHSCSADLVVCNRPIENQPAQTFAHPGDVIVGAGVPVLVSPPAVDSLNASKVIIGWKNTRESRRAIWDALPFLKRAEDVRVVQVLSRSDEGQSEWEVGQVVERLHRHSVKARGQTVPETAPSVALDLINVADACEAGLIVVGGYGHTRAQEWVFGGVTRDLLSASPKCILFSH